MRTLLLRHFVTGIVAIAAALQWSVVLERTWAAVWAWYKFAGYGGGGHIVVGPPYSGRVLAGVLCSRLHRLCAFQNRNEGGGCRSLGEACSTRLVFHCSMHSALVRSTFDPTGHVYTQLGVVAGSY